MLGTRFGVKAYELVRAGKFGRMAALRGNAMVATPLSKAAGRLKTVDRKLYEMAKRFFG
jgi:6-phosphofructokinase 1